MQHTRSITTPPQHRTVELAYRNIARSVINTLLHIPL